MATRISDMLRAGSRILAVVTAMVAGLFTLADMFLSRWSGAVPVPGVREAITGIGSLFVTWTTIILAFALALGVVNVVRVHWRSIRQRTSSAVYSAVLLISLALTLVFGLSGPDAPASRFIFQYILQPLESTLFALLAFFLFTAAYRALRIRSVESFFFVLFAVIVLLGQTPVGIYLWSELPVIKDWVLNVPAMAGARGILLGVSLGVIATGLRVLTGTDRPYTD